MRHRKRNIVLLILLALLCVTGVELAACYYFAPEVYRMVTAPVVRGAAAAGGLVRDGLSQVSRLWERDDAPEDGSPVNQLAGDPTLTSDRPLSDPSVTELVLEQDGTQYLTGGALRIRYFNQGDPEWASQPYGSDDIGHYGCGPTAMAMAVDSMAGAETDPASMSAWAVEQGYWARKSGSYLSIVEGTAAAFGLQAEPIGARTPEAIRDALLSGDLLVALMGPGHFTNGGHFILLRAMTLDGEILVADPNSTERSLTSWDPQLILDELSHSTSNGAPLWVLSRPEG